MRERKDKNTTWCMRLEQNLMHGLANMAEDPLDCEESLRGEVVLLPAEIMEELATLGHEHPSGIMKELGTLALASERMGEIQEC